MNIESEGVWIDGEHFPAWRQDTEMTNHEGGVSIIENPETLIFVSKL